ncbi:MAG: TIGR03617 family F420-dependent LLM class oxidoreductase [Dehalococcoidia bacterium]
MKVFYRLASQDPGAIAAEAAWAEKMGYDGVSSNETAHDPFMPLVLAATATSRVILETHVAIAFPRSPMVVAYTGRDLQDLSRGRFRLGLGTQVKGHIERRFSTKWESPGPKLREYVSSLRHIWDCWESNQSLNYQGKYYQFSLMTPFFSPGPGQYSAPPVFTAAVNPYNCRVAGEVSDGLALHSLTSAEYVRQVVKPNLEQGAQQAGRIPGDLKISGGGFIITGPNRSSLKAQEPDLRRRIAFYASTRTYLPVLECHGFQQIGARLHRMSLEGQWEEMGNLVTDKMLEAFAVIGEYDEIAPKFRQRYQGLLDEVGFSIAASSTPEEAQLRKIIQALQDQDH